MRNHTLLVVVFVLLSGCGGEIAANSPGETPDSVTPSGVSETSIEPLEVANTHGSTLSAESYSTNHTTRVTFTNGTVYTEITRSGTVVDRDHYLITVENRGSRAPTGTGPHVAYYAADETGQKLTVDWNGNRSVSPVRGGLPSPIQRFGFGDDDRIYQLLVSANETRVTPDGAGAETEIALSGAESLDFPLVSNRSSANVTLRVSSEGIVTELVVNYTATVDGEPVRVQTVVRYDEIGTATVDRPDWVETE
jgi:hypothetical protein